MDVKPGIPYGLPRFVVVPASPQIQDEYVALRGFLSTENESTSSKSFTEFAS